MYEISIGRFRWHESKLNESKEKTKFCYRLNEIPSNPAANEFATENLL